MEIPWFPILTVAVVIDLCWTGWCCWRSSQCCREAHQAWVGAEKLYEWVHSAHEPLICAVKATNCEPGAGGDWPPPDVGTFPPAGT